MRHPVLTLALAAVLTAACAIARADYVTATQGGYGPFACARDGGGPLPSWGFVETFLGSFYTYECQRYRGDVQTATHVGRAVSLPGDPFLAVKVSPQYTTEYACSSIVAGNSPIPCDAWVQTSTDNPYLGDWRNGSVTGYLPACPLTTGLGCLYPCTGSYTPYDGSGLPTAVVSDCIPQTGLPHGSPLKLQPAGAVGVDVSCVATMSNYPAVPNGGRAQWMAVYACP